VEVRLPLKVRQPTPEMEKHFGELAERQAKTPNAKPSRDTFYGERIALLKDAPAEVEVPLQAIRIGDLAISGIPFEVFAETGLELKERVPFAETFTVELANGSYGYLPTPEQHRLGGYETWLGTNFVQ